MVAVTEHEQPAAAQFVDVAVPVPLRRTFTYAVPDGVAPLIPGSRHAVPFGRRRLAGFVLGPATPNEAVIPRIKPLGAALDPDPVFSEELLAFLRDAARYYLHPVGEVLETAAPPLSAAARRRLAGRGGEGDEEPEGVVERRLWVAHPTEQLRSEELPSRLGTRQRRVLRRLLEEGPLDESQLRADVEQPRQVLRTLQRRGLVRIEERPVQADPWGPSGEGEAPPPEPTPAQRFVLERLLEHLPETPERRQRGGALPFLLHGVTGSGKTEVYLRLIEAARRRNLSAIVLVPEIALTPQLVGRFRARFGDQVEVLHSERTDRERRLAWQALRSGRARIAVGARSALFAPVVDLGVLVVDEEHDASFKQEDGFRYHARDMALLRAHRAGALCVLGSATPSIESYQLARTGRVGLLELPERPTPHPLPRVEIVDMRRQRPAKGEPALLSHTLVEGLRGCLERGEQAILFLNRRGFAPSLQCVGCAALVQCPACSVALTEHRRAGLLRCHYCDYRTPVPEACPSCGAPELRRLGLGTERLEEEVARLLPGARVGRLDRDTARGRGAQRLLRQLRAGDLDVLVGTQMVAKGHDLPGVTLVGVVLADQSLAFPDFRAAERTFQLLTQVAGRAGRGREPGRVVLQTFQPEHPAVRFAARHDYHGFFEAEIQARRELRYVPFGHLVAVRVDAPRQLDAARAVERLAEAARRMAPVQSRQVELLGPAPAPLERLRGRWRFRFLLRSAERRPLRAVASALTAYLERARLPRPVRVALDVDPVQML